jgi:Sulfotransferase family
VCLSAINWTRRLPSLERRFPTWAGEPVITAALWWEWHVRPGHDDGVALGPERYHELRYERLVADPEGTCAALCEFLGVPYDDAMVRFHEGRTREEPGRDAKAAWLPVTPGLRDWRTELTPDDVARFEAAAGDLLEELGYERALDALPEDAQARAAATRAAFPARSGGAGELQLRH